MMKRMFLLALVIALPVSVPEAPAQQDGVWALSGGGVWIPKEGGGFTRVKWDPEKGDLGNMDSGVIFKIGDVPGNAQNGADTAAAKGYTAWNIFGDPVVGARVKFVAGNANVNSPLSWAEIGDPGSTGNALINANPRPVQLNRTRTLRTDGWSLDYGGTRPALIDEYDVFTTTVHEAGHALGLGHPKNSRGTQVMDPQDSARQIDGGSWRKIEKTTPFDGQPKKLDGTALANGARAYQNPRNDFKTGDAIGAISLYSAPIARVGANFQQGAGNGGTYSYTLVNDSAHNALTGLRAGYLSRDIRIPVDPSVNVSNLQAPSYWTITRESNDVLVSYVGPRLITGRPGARRHTQLLIQCGPASRAGGAKRPLGCRRSGHRRWQRW